MAKMSQKIFVVATIPLASDEAHNEALRQLAVCAADAWVSEPDTLKYATFLSRDPEKGNTIYVVGQYTSKEAFGKHMTSQQVQALVSWMSATDPSPLSGTPSTHFLSLPSDMFSFSRSRVEELEGEDLCVIIAELWYLPGGSETSMQYWEGVVEEGRSNEEGTLVYGLAEDLEEKEKLWIFKVYESEAYLQDVHVESEAIDASIRNTKHLRTGLTWTFLKRTNGFLHKQRTN